MGVEETIAEFTGDRPRGLLNWMFKPFGRWVMFSVVASPRDANYPLTTGQAKALLRDLRGHHDRHHAIKDRRVGWSVKHTPGFLMFTIKGHSSASSIAIPRRVVSDFAEQLEAALRDTKLNKQCFVQNRDD